MEAGVRGRVWMGSLGGRPSCSRTAVGSGDPSLCWLPTWVCEVRGGRHGQETFREPLVGSGVRGPARRPVSPVSVEEPVPQCVFVKLAEEAVATR